MARISGYVQPISPRRAREIRRTFGGHAKAWNSATTEQRYLFLTRFYPGGDATSMFSLQKWNQLPRGTRMFLAGQAGQWRTV